MARILVFSAQLPPIRCGIGDFAHKMFRQLSLTDDIALAGFSESREKNISSAEPSPIRRFLRRPSGFLAFWRFLRTGQIKVVFFQFAPWMYGGLGSEAVALCLLVKLSGVRLILHAHEQYASWDGRKWRYLIRFIMHRLVWTCCIFLANRVLISTQYETQQNRRAWPFWKEKIGYVPTASNIDFCGVSEEEKSRILEQYGLQRFGFLVFVFGLRENLIHRLDLILAAAKAFGSDPSIGIAVTGLKRDDCADLLHGRQNLVPLGYLEERTVSILMQCSHLMMAPFREGFSTKHSSVMAAFSHGLAVLSTVGFRTEQEPLDREVLVATVYEEEAFCRAFQRLRNDEIYRRRIAENGRQFYLEHWSIDNTIKVYRESLAGIA